MRPAVSAEPRLALAALGAVLAVLALCACSSGDDTPAAPRTVTVTRPLPTQTTVPGPPPTRAEATAAVLEARRGGQGLAPGSLARSVAPRAATGGWSLWSFRTSDGEPVQMIMNPAGRGAEWSGCRPEYAVADHCAGAAAAPSIFLLSGRATPAVASLVIITRSGDRRPAVVGRLGWLYFTDALPALDEDSGEQPAAFEARAPSGQVLKREPIAP
jgi:hypothetical protein